MQRLSLMIDGFLAYHEPTTITYRDGEISAITGQNGSGKTSIPDAVAWVRYGRLRIKGDSDSIINDFCEEAHVVEELVDRNGHHWKFDRRKKREKAQVLSVFSWNNVTQEWERYGTKRIADNQQIIHDLVGISMDAFYSLSVFESRAGNRGIRLVSSKSDERINILTSLKPSMDVWPKLNRVVADQTRERKRELNSQEDVLAQLRSDLAEMNQQRDDMQEYVDENGPVEDIDAELADTRRKLAGTIDHDTASQIEVATANRDRVRAEMKSKLQEVGSKISEAQARHGEIKNAETHVRELGEEITEINAQIASTTEQRNKAQKSLAKLKKKLEDNDQASGKSSERVASLNAARESMENLLDDLEERLRAAEDSDGKCVVCGSTIDDAKSHEIVHNLSQQMDEAEKKLEDNDNQAKETKKEREKYQRAVREARTSISAAEQQIETAGNVLHDLKLDLNDAEKALEREQEILDKADDDRDVLNERIEKLKVQRDNIEEKEQERVDELTREIVEIKKNMPRANDVRALENAVKRIERERDEFVSTVSKIEQIDKQIEQKSARTSSQQQTIAETRQELEDLEILREATSQRGIPYLMLSDMLTNIESKADEYLALINGDDNAMGVDLVQEHESARPTLEIMVTFSDGTTRPVEALSNGEVTRVSLALMFALAYVVNMSRPGTIRDVFLDEPLAAVDDLGIEGVMVALRHAIDNGIVDSIMVVAHDRSIVDACDVEISIESIKNQWYDDADDEEEEAV